MSKELTTICLKKETRELLKAQGYVRKNEPWDSAVLRMAKTTALYEALERQGKGLGGFQIESSKPDAWAELLKVIRQTADKPLEVIGSPAAGKSSTMKATIKNASGFWLVVDTAGEYSELEEVKGFEEAMKLGKTCRILPDQEDLRYSIQDLERLVNELNRFVRKSGQKIPSDFVLVIEEAGRFKEINFLGNEIRKFCKAVLISPNPIWGERDTLEKVRIISERGNNN